MPLRVITPDDILVALGFTVPLLLSLSLIDGQIIWKRSYLFPPLFPLSLLKEGHVHHFIHLKADMAKFQCFRKVVGNALYFGSVLLFPLPLLPRNDFKALLLSLF